MTSIDRVMFGLFLLMVFLISIGRVFLFEEVGHWLVNELIRWGVFGGSAIVYIRLSGTRRLFSGLLTWPTGKQWRKVLLDTSLFVLFSVLLIQGLLRQPLLYVSSDLSLGVFFGIVSTAVIEELFFRGLVLRQLSQWMPFSMANGTTAVLFVLWHLPAWVYFMGAQPFQAIQGVALFFLGLLLGWFVNKTGSIWPAVVAHLVNNYVFTAVVRFLVQ